MKAASLEKKLTGHGAYKMRIPRNKIRGKGGYFWDKIKEYGGKALRGAITGVAGEGAGNFFNQITGLGKYKVRRNALLMPGTSEHANYQDTSVNVESLPEVGRPPSFGTDGTGSDILFTHSEYVQDITANDTFQSQSFLLNPGNPVLFPWLSQIASLYEMYEMLGLVFQVRTTCLNATTSGLGVGTINLATEYDVYDAGFDSKKAMDACEFSSSSLPTENQLHPIECDPKRAATRMSYVEPGVSVIAGIQGDARLDFMGSTTVASVGQPSAYNGQIIGELWVSYKVRLSRPILENNLVTTAFTQHVQGSLGTAAATLSIANNYVAGGAPFTVTLTNTGTHAYINVANTNGFEGEYLILFKCSWLSNSYGNITNPSGAAFSNLGLCTLVNTWLVDTSACCLGGPLSTNSPFNYQFVGFGVFSFTGSGNALLALPDCSTGAATYDFVIVPYSSVVTKQRDFDRKQKEDSIYQKLDSTNEELLKYKDLVDKMSEKLDFMMRKQSKNEALDESEDHISKLITDENYHCIDVPKTCDRHCITYKAKHCPICIPS